MERSLAPERTEAAHLEQVKVEMNCGVGCETCIG
jgi:ferredoxin